MPIDLDPIKFQSFEEISDPRSVAPRVRALRERLEEHGLDAFLVPLANAHRGESLPPGEKRLAYISGFTGSAGIAVIGKNRAALFVDGRYTLQAPAQTDTDVFDVLPLPAQNPAGWARGQLKKGARIGFDPWLHTPDEMNRFTQEVQGHGIFVPVRNLVDEIWTDRPGPPTGSVELLDVERAGVSRGDKLDSLRRTLEEKGADALVLTLPESICWLFNMRGRDVPNTPVVLCFAIVSRTGKPTLYLDPARLTENQRDELSRVVDIADPSGFVPDLSALGRQNAAVWIDPGTCPCAVRNALKESGAVLVGKGEPVLAAKAIKNEAELAGMRQAHLLDGVAMARFLCWFDAHAPAGTLSEIDIVTALEAFRRRDDTLVDVSFETIAGAGPNGAIVHYRVTTGSNRILKPGELMLVDSGGQYLSGTTDITRTLSTGSVTQRQRRNFTRVLKGMIAISTLNFPKGTTGAQIDVLARHALWQAGLNYAHGTGHGVGAFLGVHEGPAGIAPRYHVPLEAGMILSNEPGYYEENAYGIRIENLVHVIASNVGKDFLAFETLTLAPIDTRLIDTALLSSAERDWLDAYHARVLEKIAPHLDGETRNWLQRATRPL